MYPWCSRTRVSRPLYKADEARVVHKGPPKSLQVGQARGA
jgi:hypothetical protein